jgi:hypothetical protein
MQNVKTFKRIVHIWGVCVLETPVFTHSSCTGHPEVLESFHHRTLSRRESVPAWPGPRVHPFNSLGLPLTPSAFESSISNVPHNSRQCDRMWGVPTRVSCPCMVLEIQFQPLLSNINLWGKRRREVGREQLGLQESKGIVQTVPVRVLLRQGVGVLQLMRLRKAADCGILHQLRGKLRTLFLFIIGQTCLYKALQDCALWFLMLWLAGTAAVLAECRKFFGPASLNR